jgi:hypothetical protein
MKITKYSEHRILLLVFLRMKKSPSVGFGDPGGAPRPRPTPISPLHLGPIAAEMEPRE